MRFQISLKPSKYEMNLYEGVKLSITAENDGETPVSFQTVRDVVPEGFTKLQARSSFCSSDPIVKNNSVAIGETLEPGEDCHLLTLFLMATRVGNFSYHPKIMVDGQERETEERFFSIQSRFKRKAPLVNLNINRKYEIQPDETVELQINVTSKNPEDIDYLVLLDAIPGRLIREVKKEGKFFRLGESNLAVLERLPPRGKKNFKIKLKTKSYAELRSVTELSMIEEELAPQVIAKTNQGLVRWDPKTYYTFRLDARPKLSSPLLHFEETEHEEPTIFQHRDDQKRDVYFKQGKKVIFSLKFRKESPMALHGVRITNFLPTEFEILEVLSETDLSVSPSLIKVPELIESDCSFDLKVKTPKQSGKFLIRPAINCNEIQEKIMTSHPLRLHTISSEDVRKAGLASFDWSFSPAPPIHRNSSVNLKIHLQNEAILPLKDVKINFDLPYLQDITMETANSLLESKEGEILIPLLKPNQKLSLDATLTCPEEASIGNWTGTLRMKWDRFGEIQKRTEEKEYSIKEEKSKGLIGKLQFWKS